MSAHGVTTYKLVSLHILICYKLVMNGACCVVKIAVGNVLRVSSSVTRVELTSDKAMSAAVKVFYVSFYRYICLLQTVLLLFLQERYNCHQL